MNKPVNKQYIQTNFKETSWETCVAHAYFLQLYLIVTQKSPQIITNCFLVFTFGTFTCGNNVELGS